MTDEMMAEIPSSSSSASTIVAASDEQYKELIEKHKQRAERFGMELKEPTFKGMIPTHKRYAKPPPPKRASPFDLPLEEISPGKFEERKKKFSTDEPEEWMVHSFQTLISVYRKQHKLKSAGTQTSGFLPSEALRILKETSVSRAHALHLYGVDKLKTKDIFSFFGSFPPEFIEWLDDSSCNAVFVSDEQALLAFEALGTSSHSLLSSLFPDGHEEEREEEIAPDTKLDNEGEEIEHSEEKKSEESLLATEEFLPTTEDLKGFLGRWKVCKLQRARENTFMMRMAALEDKQLGIQERLDRYHKKHPTKGKHSTKGKNRRSGNEPYPQNRNRNRREKKGEKTRSVLEMESDFSVDESAKLSRAQRFGL